MCEKVDANFACWPSARLIAAEAECSRATVIEHQRALELDLGLVTIVPQYRPNGSQTSNRIYINHPDAPHVRDATMADDLRSTRRGRGDAPLAPRGGSSSRTGGVQLPDRGGPAPGQGGSSSRTPRGSSSRTPRITQVNNHPTTHAARADQVEEVEKLDSEQTAATLLAALPAPWLVGATTRGELAPRVAEALRAGWSPEALAAHLAAAPDGVRSGAAVLRRRVADIPPPPGGGQPRSDAHDAAELAELEELTGRLEGHADRLGVPAASLRAQARRTLMAEGWAEDPAAPGRRNRLAVARTACDIAAQELAARVGAA